MIDGVVNTRGDECGVAGKVSGDIGEGGATCSQMDSAEKDDNIMGEESKAGDKVNDGVGLKNGVNVIGGPVPTLDKVSVQYFI